MEISLAGKVALVTGAGPNIGSGIALALGKDGGKGACDDIGRDAAKNWRGTHEGHDGAPVAVDGEVTGGGADEAYSR